MDLEIKTERLILRPFRREDGVRVRELAGVWDVAKMVIAIPHPYPEGAAETWISTHDKARRSGTGYAFAITEGDRLVGCISIDDRDASGVLELGYWLGMPYWGLGYATEAAQAIIDFAFAWLGKDRLRAHHMVENTVSARVLHKLGFVAVGRDQGQCLARNAVVDTIDLVLRCEDYVAKIGISTS